MNALDHKVAQIIRKHGHYCPVMHRYEFSLYYLDDTDGKVKNFGNMEISKKEKEEIVEVWEEVMNAKI